MEVRPGAGKRTPTYRTGHRLVSPLSITFLVAYPLLHGTRSKTKKDGKGVR